MTVLFSASLQVLHVGDRFSDTGNDTATRDCCSIVWVANPEETGFFVKMLLKVGWLTCKLPCCIAAALQLLHR
jgi:IMP and pyridine-specific 5'-nucleotidase